MAFRYPRGRLAETDIGAMEAVCQDSQDAIHVVRSGKSTKRTAAASAFEPRPSHLVTHTSPLSLGLHGLMSA